ncbi:MULTISPECIES: hypothetical protein [unclassified Treponema]|uniref:hypothetical protein n=1 Tax=unclassified Treponema TaxID=2638727 RepID=UPI0020A38226|nr:MULTISPECIES: hypothetical protein [unclassified Treponema]UTC67616.1 hypothetical protein E4O06_02805 [Treponema sp. OMZ 789]UTC70344.1 hypothetical protein E4O01_02795 [Treponema sp. OMZ 790]UTC73058.1 hypothetical protein E4O02_02795 [Treponema sp. OMZ 791]
MRRNRGNKDANGDIGFSLGNPIQGLSDVIFGACGCNCGCDCGRDGRDNWVPIFCCIGGGSGHLIDES